MILKIKDKKKSFKNKYSLFYRLIICLIVTGRVALLDPVPKAVVKALVMFAINLETKVKGTAKNI